MGSGSQTLPYLLLFLFVWCQVSGIQGHEFRFGPCRVKGVVLSELWKAFWAVKNTVQAQDNVTSIQLLKPEVLQKIPDAESCYVVRALLKFYLNVVFKNYYNRAEFKILKPLSTLANNFIIIKSQLQPRENELFSIKESAHRRFLLFQRAFKQLNKEAAMTKAFGEMDILLTWMEKFYHQL